MTWLADWIRYRIARLIAVPRPPVWDETRYPRTARGGWRYWREQVCPAEVTWYEGWRPGEGR